MHIESGCTVHLVDGELPLGRLIVVVSRHLTAVIDGVIHDTYDPQRNTMYFGPDGKISRIAGRCVYGYWVNGDGR